MASWSSSWICMRRPFENGDLQFHTRVLGVLGRKDDDGERLALPTQEAKPLLAVLGAAHHPGLHTPLIVLIARQLLIVDESSRGTRLVAVSDVINAVKLTFSSLTLVNCHHIVVIVVHPLLFIAVKFWHGAIVTEKK